MDSKSEGGALEQASSDGDGVNAHSRYSFDVRSGLDVEVRSASGDLRVVRAEGLRCEVRLSTDDPDAQKRLARAECSYDPATNRLLVDTGAGFRMHASEPGFRKVLSHFRETMRHDVDVELVLPAPASIKFASASGDLRCESDVQDVDVTNASGNVHVAQVGGDLRFRSASGDIVAGEVVGAVESKTVSGDVALGRVHGGANVQSVSGDVSLSLDRAVSASVNTVSGDVRVGVVAGLFIDVDANTVSGELSSEIALDGAQSGSADESIRLRVRTVSGDLKVQRLAQ